MKLDGNAALVTGAGAGAGRVIVHCLAKQAANVVINRHGGWVLIITQWLRRW